MPGTIGGAFIVDYVGPKYTMVRIPSTVHLLTFNLTSCVLEDSRSGVAGHHWFHHERSLRPTEEESWCLAVVYGIFLSFGELGPGNCLGLLAAKSGTHRRPWPILRCCCRDWQGGRFRGHLVYVI